MDLEQFRDSIVNMLGILKFIYNKGSFLASDIKLNFNLSATTVYRYLEVWVKQGYVIQGVNNQSNDNGAHYIYRITPQFKWFFKDIVGKLKKIVNIERLDSEIRHENKENSMVIE